MSDFDKLYSMLLERYGGYSESVGIFYHGTKLNNLRSILKHGLVIGKQSTGWGAETLPGVHEPTLSPIPNSIYVTQYIGTAMEASGHAPEGSLIIVLQLTDKILKTDEDDIKYIISPDIIDVTQTNTSNDDNIIKSHKQYLQNSNYSDKFMDSWITDTITSLHNLDILSNIQLDIIINKLPDIYKIFLYRQCSYIPKYREFLGLTKTTNFYESKYLQVMEWLSTQTRKLVKKTNDNEEPYENGRLNQSVGFSGKNKIICIFSVKNHTEATLHYGTPPEEIKDLYFKTYE